MVATNQKSCTWSLHPCCKLYTFHITALCLPSHSAASPKMPARRPHKSCAGGCCRMLQVQSWAGSAPPCCGFVPSNVLEKKVLTGLFHTRSYHLCPWQPGLLPLCPWETLLWSHPGAAPSSFALSAELGGALQGCLCPCTDWLPAGAHIDLAIYIYKQGQSSIFSPAQNISLAVHFLVPISSAVFWPQKALCGQWGLSALGSKWGNRVENFAMGHSPVLCPAVSKRWGGHLY